jgi:hypothetical protein
VSEGILFHWAKGRQGGHCSLGGDSNTCRELRKEVEQSRQRGEGNVEGVSWVGTKRNTAQYLYSTVQYSMGGRTTNLNRLMT